ncbi:hypothetical protein PFFCH_03571 [Plasmodium falciparum FCH/4]|uniref:Uncharacterized protein n=1 Tax=Plasmodium falciparum FCH/4 TaxID=1036724 RepID=A0A024VL48_PLAFA|nr:hypothetical protein PFFCH_03571 [Plasmodium falciparum FCH/4]
MDRLNKYLSRQKYVVRRSEGSPYRNFLLYVEEIYQVTVVYPIKYLFDIPLKYYEYFKSYKKKDIDNKNLKQFCNIIKEQHEINNEQQKCFCCYCRQDDMVFPLFSHFNYKKAKFKCNKKVYIHTWRKSSKSIEMTILRATTFLWTQIFLRIGLKIRQTVLFIFFLLWRYFKKFSYCKISSC